MTTMNECADAPHPDDGPWATACGGEVLYRSAPSGSGHTYPRCEVHQDAAEERMRDINEDYPRGPMPPAWFDPLNAGESW